MEWCLKLYDDRQMMLERFKRSVLVLIVLCFAATVSETGWTGAGKSPDAAKVSLKVVEALPNKDVPQNSSIESVEPQILIETIAPVSDEGTTDMHACVGLLETSDVETVPVLPETPDVETVPVLPETPDVETVPVLPETPDVETVPVLPETPDTDIMNGHIDTTLPESDTEEKTEITGPTIVDGFYIDAQGMITGIAEQSVIVDGYMELPAEKCTGIRSGAFTSLAEGIREIYIPANIIYIETGAFSGMGQTEWIEKEASGGCYTEDGVLFSENGTCILAFPAARTGSYKVPDHVTKFAPDAFCGAQITVLDTASAQIADFGNVPDYIEVI